jgi:hypothetical protein
MSFKGFIEERGRIDDPAFFIRAQLLRQAWQCRSDEA